MFKSEIIQPLLDMAAGIPPPVVTPVLPGTTATMSNNTPGNKENDSINLSLPLGILPCLKCVALLLFPCDQ